MVPRWRSRRLPALALALAFPAFLASPAGAGLDDVLKVLGKFYEVNQYLWILGDKGAEKRLGGMLAQYFLATQKISRDRQLVGYVNSIFDRLVAAAPRSGFRYRIHVVDDGTVNAFALPGGTMFVHRGILDLAGSDDEVAAVLGHEIGHVVRRHSLQRFRRDAVAMALIHQLLKNSHEDKENLAKLAYLFTSTSFSRKNEDESDALGMQIALDAGFDPSGAPALWEKMQARYGSSGLAFLSSHPSHQARVANTRKWITSKGLTYQRPMTKSYDSRTRQLMNLVRNAGFETGSAGRPASWKVLEGEAAWLSWPVAPGNSGASALESGPPPGASLLLASDPVLATMFHTPRVLSGWFQAISGRPRVYLGVAYLDRAGKLLAYQWAGGEAVEVGPEWTELVSPPLDPKEFPKGTDRLEVRLYLGRLTGGRIRVDDVTLTPVETRELERRSLLAGGDFETDRNGDRIPDGDFQFTGATWDTAQAGRGFASVRLQGPASGAPSRSALTTPLLPVRRGRRFEVALLARAEPAPRKLRIHWIGYDRDGRRIEGGPPAKEIEIGEDWMRVSDALRIDPPPGTPEVAQVRIQAEAELATGHSVWLDAMTFAESEGTEGADDAAASAETRQAMQQARQDADTPLSGGEGREPAPEETGSEEPTPGASPEDPDAGSQVSDQDLYGDRPSPAPPAPTSGAPIDPDRKPSPRSRPTMAPPVVRPVPRAPGDPAPAPTPVATSGAPR